MAEVLQTTSSTKPKMSWEEFLTAGEEWQRWELVDEEVEFMSPTGQQHGGVNYNLIGELQAYTKQHREWVGFSAETAFTMASGNWRCPDAALVRAKRLPRKSLPARPADFAPDVAFEVYSPGDTTAQIARKRKDYQESGVIQVWIDPQKRGAEVAYPDGRARYFDEQELLVIDGLENFALDLKALFGV